MKRIELVLSLLVVAGLLVFARGVAAAEPVYRLDVKGMHCAGCAAKLTGKIKAIKGVGSAEADPVKGLLVVTPKAAIKLSPKALWETVETAGYNPAKLVCPAGTFTSKPKI